jgi:hypothetical protein
MEERGPRALFAGDLADPWVASIADALPRATRRLPCPGPLPDRWPDGLELLVVHRGGLGDDDAERLRRLRARAPEPPRIVLCVGAHARYHQIERWLTLVDALLPEATAPEVVARHARPTDAPPRRRPDDSPAVAVVGGAHDLRLTLAEALRRAGYAPHPARDWPDAPAGVPAVWCAPMLEADWPARLAREAPSRPVLLLGGFLDRAAVELARRSGAAACLDLPTDPADLIFVLDRLLLTDPGPPVHRAHTLPPAPALFRIVERARLGPDRLA